jgi:hypothetical protein
MEGYPMITNGYNIARILRAGWGAYTITEPHDGVSAVPVGADGMFRAVIPVGRMFALAAELDGRAMNLLFPYPGICCAHGLVRRELVCGADQSATCACGQEPIGVNPPRDAGRAA